MTHRKNPSHRGTLSSIIVVAIITLSFILIFFYADKEVNQANLEYIRACGYTADTSPAEVSYISVPETLDAVYSAYNAIIKEAGFDLNEYAGKTVTRYSYSVQNYDSSNTAVRINILVYRKKIIAADISSLSKDGFILPLLPKEN
ncbi:MAG: DUF4830 domain-containing protein [Clostridia bacterium]|nr:DUF4830 domain-containing protein [Clostridia bacterium]